MALVLPAAAGAAGVFGGAEVDDEGQSFVYVGGATDGKIFFSALAGHLEYQFREGGALRDAEITSITLSVGMRKEGPITLTLGAGPVLREKKEENAGGESRTTEAGGAVQLGGYLYGDGGSLEALASYATLDDFFWGRLRGKRQAVGDLYAGAEVFLMGNSDFDGWGAGPLVEFRAGRVTLGAKAGYKHTSTFKGGAYVGLEIYAPF